MLVRAVKFEILIVEDVHVTADELAEFIMEAIELHINPRRVELEIIEDHETYMDSEQAEA